MSSQLSIVIPYYKRQFLKQTLASLLHQTCRDFVVVIGDDASPEDPACVIWEFSGPLPVRYHRFSENLGGVSLVRHWNRCVRLTGSEWVWLLCDDDEIEPDCVAEFYQALASGDLHHVYRFNTSVINDDGNIVQGNPNHPLTETAAEFGYARLAGERQSYVSEYIFKKDFFERMDGFVEFPIGWGSDDASWILFAGDSPICTIPGPRVRWRRGAANISGSSRHWIRAKLRGAEEFAAWITRHLPARSGDRELRALVCEWFYGQAENLHPALSWNGCRQLAGRLPSFLGRTRWYHARRLGRIKWRHMQARLRIQGGALLRRLHLK